VGCSASPIRITIKLATESTAFWMHAGQVHREECSMIHYSCDLCKRPIDADEDLRYVVKIEVYAAIDPVEVDANGDDRDHLQEMQDILQRMEEAGSEAGSDAVGDDVYQQLRFDLCPECRKKFVKNPLGREASKQFDFSKN
jgi:hypothetical protein